MNLNPKKNQQWKSHMNVSVAIQDQLKTIEVSVLISCLFLMFIWWFPLKIKALTFCSYSLGKR